MLHCFHGGCEYCISQEQYGLVRCVGCQYFDANWSKPDLSINPTRKSEEQLKHNLRVIASQGKLEKRRSLMFKFLSGAFISSIFWGGIMLSIAWYWFVIVGLVLLFVWVLKNVW